MPARPAAAPGLPPPPAIARTPAPRPRSHPAHKSRRTAWLWALVGFVSGIVFWHFIGFWGFVSAVLLPPSPVRSDAGHAPRSAVAQSSSALPIRAARPRAGKASHGTDASAPARDGEIEPVTFPARIISAAE